MDLNIITLIGHMLIKLKYYCFIQGVIIMIEIKEGINKFYLGDTLESSKAEVTYVHANEDTIIINHTFVSNELRGQNVGKQLIKKVVAFARQENKKIIPQCSFANKEFIKNKEYEDVLFNENN